MPPYLATAIDCFAQADFVAKVDHALNRKIRIAKDDPEKQRKELSDNIKQLRACLKETLAKKDAMRVAYSRFEQEASTQFQQMAAQGSQAQGRVAELEAQLSNYSEEKKRMMSEISTKSSKFSDDLKHRLGKLEAMEEELMAHEAIADKERAGARHEERARAFGEVQQMLTTKQEELDARMRDVQRKEAQMRDRVVEFEAAEEKQRQADEEAAVQRQAAAAAGEAQALVEGQLQAAEARIHTLERTVAQLEEQLGEVRIEEEAAQASSLALQQEMERQRADFEERSETTRARHEAHLKELKDAHTKEAQALQDGLEKGNSDMISSLRKSLLQEKESDLASLKQELLDQQAACLDEQKVELAQNEVDALASLREELTGEKHAALKKQLEKDQAALDAALEALRSELAEAHEATST